MALVSIGGSHLRSVLGLVGGLALVLATGTGCQNALYSENKQLREQNRELQAKVDQQNELLRPSQNAPIAPPESPKAPSQKAEIRSSLPSAMPAAAPISAAEPSALPPVAGPADLGGEVTVDAVAGTTTVNFLGDALFLSGQATLVQSAKENLNKLAVALKKQYAGKPVKVQGHSDSDPIKHSTWKDNQQLSEARAKAVRDYLVTKGVPTGLITSEGFGSTKPKSPTDKSKNRRVEIVVLTK